MTARPSPRAPPATRARACPASRTPGCSPGAAPSSTTSPCPGMLHACFVRSPFARAADPRHRRVRGRSRCPGVRFVFTAADLEPAACTSSGTRSIGPQGPETPRPPLAERRGALRRRPGGARRSPRAATSPRTPPTWSRSTTIRCPRSSTTRPPPSADDLVHAAHGSNVIGEIARPAHRRARRGVRRRRPTSRARRSTSRRYAAVPMECRGIVVDAAPRHRRAHDLRRHAGARTSGGCSAPGCSASPSTASASSSATPAAASARRSWCSARTCASCWPRPKVGAPGEVDRGPAREPAGRRASPARSRPTPGSPSTTTARSSPPTSTSSPTAAPTRRRGRSATAAAVGMLFPGPYRVPDGVVHDRRPSTRTPSAGRRTAGRGSSRRWPARCCSTSPPATWASTRSSCAAATCCARTSCRTEPERHDLRQHLAARDARAGRRDARLRRRSAPSRPRPEPRVATSASASSTYVEPSTPGYGVLRHRGGDDPHRAVGQGERLRRRRLDREQPRDDRRPAHRRRPRRRRSRTSPRSRATPRSPASAPAPPAAAAAR